MGGEEGREGVEGTSEGTVSFPISWSGLGNRNKRPHTFQELVDPKVMLNQSFLFDFLISYRDKMIQCVKQILEGGKR